MENGYHFLAATDAEPFKQMIDILLERLERDLPRTRLLALRFLRTIGSNHLVTCPTIIAKKRAGKDTAFAKHAAFYSSCYMDGCRFIKFS